MQTATFDAQFGNTEGGVTSISIKSGTNDFHGSAYYWIEPGGWAANDFFGNARGQGRPFTYSNRPGFSINGPVRIPWLYNGKDKTFFLFGYEGIRDERPRFDAGASVFVPTAGPAQRRLLGLPVRRRADEQLHQHLRPADARLRAAAASSPGSRSPATSSRRSASAPSPAPSSSTTRCRRTPA